MASRFLQFACVFALCSLAVSQRGKTCSTGVEESAEGEAIDGAHSARLGFQMMKEASRDPNIMMDAMKDLQDPESQAEVQRMMQDPAFRAEVERYKAELMKDPSFMQHMEAIKNNPEYVAKLGEKIMSEMGQGSAAGMGAGAAGAFGARAGSAGGAGFGGAGAGGFGGARNRFV